MKDEPKNKAALLAHGSESKKLTVFPSLEFEISPLAERRYKLSPLSHLQLCQKKPLFFKKKHFFFKNKIKRAFNFYFHFHLTLERWTAPCLQSWHYLLPFTLNSMHWSTFLCLWIPTTSSFIVFFLPLSKPVCSVLVLVAKDPNALMIHLNNLT